MQPQHSQATIPAKLRSTEKSLSPLAARDCPEVAAGGEGGEAHSKRASSGGHSPIYGGKGVAKTGSVGTAALTPDYKEESGCREMTVKNVEPDQLLIAAGECFMFLLWSETAMCDLVVLKEGDEGMRRRYSGAFGKEPHPNDFSSGRLELGMKDFTVIKDRFLSHWPQWQDRREVRDAIERVVIWRNGLGHANVQPFRRHLLYTPTRASWERIRNYMRCHQCDEYHKDCGCHHENLAEPYSVIVNDETIRTIYEDIRTVDVECLYPAAASLDVEYRGLAWPTEHGKYMLKEHHYSGN